MLISVPNALVLSGDLFGERNTGGGRPAMELRGNPMPIRSGLIALSALLCASTASAEVLQWRPSEARTIGTVIRSVPVDIRRVSDGLVTPQLPRPDPVATAVADVVGRDEAAFALAEVSRSAPEAVPPSDVVTDVTAPANPGPVDAGVEVTPLPDQRSGGLLGLKPL
jgi:hypothetical protein